MAFLFFVVIYLVHLLCVCEESGGAHQLFLRMQEKYYKKKTVAKEKVSFNVLGHETTEMKSGV